MTDATGRAEDGAGNQPLPPPASGPNWLRRAANWTWVHLKDNQWLFVLMIVLNLAVILGGSAIWYALDGDPTAVGVTAAALLAFAGSTATLITRRDPNSPDAKRITWSPLILLGTPIAVLLVGLVALGVWMYESSRSVDLTHSFTLSSKGPFRDGDTVVATAHTDDPKSRLTVRFTVSPDDPRAPTCIPGTQLTLALETGGGAGTPETRNAEEEFTLALGSGLKDIRLSVSIHAEFNCAVDLSIESAHLDS